MPYADPADRVKHDAKLYVSKKGYYAKKFQSWKLKNPKRYAFLGQRHTSKQRGVKFDLTFEEWKEFWGEDFWKRGKEPSDLVMARHGDKGAYELDNIYKTTGKENKRYY